MTETKKKKINPRKLDSHFNIKHIAYHQSQLPSEKVTLAQFVRFCKFQLCIKNRVLMKDPVWDNYTREEILIEYYAHMFDNSEKERVAFENLMGNSTIDLDDFASWADKKMEEDESELPGELEDKVSLSPDTIGE